MATTHCRDGKLPSSLEDKVRALQALLSQWADEDIIKPSCFIREEYERVLESSYLPTEHVIGTHETRVLRDATYDHLPPEARTYLRALTMASSRPIQPEDAIFH
jgi:hypothetical protein